MHRSSERTQSGGMKRFIGRWPVRGAAFLLASCLALAGTTGSIPQLSKTLTGQSVNIALPAVEEPAVLTFQSVEPDKAVAINAAIPTSFESLSPAVPFNMGAAFANMGAHMTAVECLTSAVYFEAATESLTGQRAVAQVVLNRVRHPAYPNSVCGVVFQGSSRATGCQFTFTCDGSLSRQRNPMLWRRAAQIAEEALAGRVEYAVGTATHYHTVYVVPYWQSSLTKVATVGAHIFYRWTGGTGRTAAFAQRYAEGEVLPTKLAALFNAPVDMTAAAIAETPPSAPQTNVIPASGLAPAPEIQAPARLALAADAEKSTLKADELRGVLARN